MCVGGGQKSKISVFDRLKQQILDKQAAAKGGTTVTSPTGKTTTTPTAASTVIEGAQGNTAASGVAGDRVAGSPDPALDPFGLSGLMSTLLKIGGQNKTSTDPNAVGAGRIGRAFGASDLRIGR